MKRNNIIKYKKDDGAIEINSLEEYLEIRDLLSILCRIPYVDYFKDQLKHYFARLVGEEEVDRFLNYNQHKDTLVNVDTLTNLFIKFCIKYYPERSAYLINHLVTNIREYTIKQSLNESSGSRLLDNAYYKELEKALRPIPSFVDGMMYMNNTINIVTAPPGGGKSLFIMSELIYQSCINNKKSILFVVGDMDEYAVIKRIRTIIEHFKKELSHQYKNISDMIESRITNITYVVESYGNLTIYDIKKRVENDNFDFIFIDYDDNLVPMSAIGTDNMYLAMARPYLVMDKIKHGSVIIFAAQGKPSSWRTNYDISSGFLASSSRKEQIADSIFVIRKATNARKKSETSSKRIYELFVLKDRHGLNPVGQAIAQLQIAKGALLVTKHEEEWDSIGETPF